MTVNRLKGSGFNGWCCFIGVHHRRGIGIQVSEYFCLPYRKFQAVAASLLSTFRLRLCGMKYFLSNDISERYAFRMRPLCLTGLTQNCPETHQENMKADRNRHYAGHDAANLSPALAHYTLGNPALLSIPLFSRECYSFIKRAWPLGHQRHSGAECSVFFSTYFFSATRLHFPLPHLYPVRILHTNISMKTVQPWTWIELLSVSF